MKRIGVHASLTDAAAREGFAEAMGVGARDRGMSHPDLLTCPALPLWPGLRRLTEQRPLDAVGIAVAVFEIGGDVPPLDPIVGMWPVIGWKRKAAARHDGRKSGDVVAEASKDLRPRGARTEAESGEPDRKRAPRKSGPSAHWQTP